MAQEAGFDVSKADWLRYQAKETLELTDEELDIVAGGFLELTGCNIYGTICTDKINTVCNT